MYGSYAMMDMDTHREFEVKIPVFLMTVPFKLN
jgi:uncharacterized protein affecting Mg2+/Co2+ transport